MGKGAVPSPASAPGPAVLKELPMPGKAKCPKCDHIFNPPPPPADAIVLKAKVSR